MFYGSHPHYHGEQTAMTPYEKARELLLELNIEQRKTNKDLNKITNLKWKLLEFHIKDVITAFDSVCATHGWGEITPMLEKETQNSGT